MGTFVKGPLGKGFFMSSLILNLYTSLIVNPNQNREVECLTENPKEFALMEEIKTTLPLLFISGVVTIRELSYTNSQLRFSLYAQENFRREDVLRIENLLPFSNWNTVSAPLYNVLFQRFEGYQLLAIIRCSVDDLFTIQENLRISIKT